MHLSRLRTDTPRKQHSNENRCRIHQVNQNDQWKGKVRVHLSRLWTDTQVQKQFRREAQKPKQKGGERGTSAPVTSADRHTGTKEVKEGNAHKEKEKRSRKEE